MTTANLIGLAMIGAVIVGAVVTVLYMAWRVEGWKGAALALACLVFVFVGAFLLASCAPVPPRTVQLGDEPAPTVETVASDPWTTPRPISILMLNMAPGTYHAYAGDDTLPFLWGYLPAPPARHALDTTLREINDERLRLGRIHKVHVEQLQGSDYHGLSLHAMTGVAVTTPVTITVRRTR